MALAVSFLFKFYLSVTSELQEFAAGLKESLPSVSVIDSRTKKAAENFITAPKAPSRGVQQYSVRKGGLNKFHPAAIDGVFTPDTEAEIEQKAAEEALRNPDLAEMVRRECNS
jgi:hypothetical protein